MDTILVDPKIRADLEHEAIRQARDISEIVNESLYEYLEKMREAKLHDEIRAYIKMHPRLKKKYLNQWVAIHEHKLVDHDAESATLRRRVREKYGRTAILIRQVRTQADPVYIIRSPKLVQ